MTQSVSKTIISPLRTSPVILKWLSVSVNIYNEQGRVDQRGGLFFITARFADICQDEGINDQSALRQEG